jgi:heat shock protein HslJ
MKVTIVVAMLFAVLSVMACQPVMPVMEDAGGQLEGSMWVLTELRGEAVADDLTVTATFDEEGALFGSGGCNNYNTSYETDGQSLTIDPMIASTMMMCPEPVMQVEQDYLLALTEATRFEIDGDMLMLSDESGDVLLTFASQSQELAGTTWRVVSYNNGKQAVVSVMAGTELTADFQENGNVGGKSGCNGYFGPFQTEGDQISVGPLAVTGKLCIDEAIMEQEMLFLQALESAATYRVEGSSLQLRTAEDAMAVNLVAAE